LTKGDGAWGANVDATYKVREIRALELALE
jgi:hypothetical protein